MLFAHFGSCSVGEIKTPKNRKVTEHLVSDILATVAKFFFENENAWFTLMGSLEDHLLADFILTSSNSCDSVDF